MLRAFVDWIVHQTGFCVCGAAIDVNRQTKCPQCDAPVYSRRL